MPSYARWGGSSWGPVGDRPFRWDGSDWVPGQTWDGEAWWPALAPDTSDIPYDAATPNQGVMHWLARAGGVDAWVNPKLAGFLSSNVVPLFFDPTNLFNNDDINPKRFTLPTGVRPTAFTIQDHGGTSGAPSGNIEIQGTLDNVSWTTIMTVTPPGASSNATLVYYPPTQTEFWNGFRLNHVPGTGFRVAHFEVFGDILNDAMFGWDFPVNKGYNGSAFIVPAGFEDTWAPTASGGQEGIPASGHINNVLENNAGGGAVTFDWGAPIYEAKALVVITFTTSGSFLPDSYLVEASQDGTTWTTLGTQAGNLGTSQGWVLVNFQANTTAWRYVRVSGLPLGRRFDEIVFYGNKK